MDENAILEATYSMYEGDADDWSATSDEYLAARRYANAAVNMWRYYDNTKWRGLFTKLSDASDGDKTITAGTYAYDCPTNFDHIVSYARTVKNSTSIYYNVIGSENRAIYDDEPTKFVYINGNPKDGYDINFNPELTLTTGDTIQYEYYKTPTEFAATTDQTEMRNPYFIVHYILYRMYKNDGEDSKSREEFSLAQQLLEQMRVDNMEGVWNQPFEIESTPGTSYGFGI